MSIADEIQRLQDAKSDIKTAIENKGVTVPSTAKLDTYNSYINSITTGTDVSNTTATESDVLHPEYFYNSSGTRVQGTMANNGSLGTTTLTKSNSSKTIPAGYTSGGTVKISTTNLSAGNIKSGVSILGVTGSLKDSEHWAMGYKTMTANATFEVTGIVDQQGTTFTPAGYAFMLAPNISSNTNITNSANALVMCFYDTINGRMYRNVLYTPAYTIRCNPSVSSGSVGSGTFKQNASGSKVYNCMGQRYFWLAWG